MPSSASAEAWLAHAEGDLALAAAGPLPGVALELFCFHAQQAAEKAIEAVLIARSQDVPHVHDIRMLLDRAEAVALVPPDLFAASALTGYAVQTRYPEDGEPVTRAELRAAVVQNRRVVAWAALWTQA